MGERFYMLGMCVMLLLVAYFCVVGVWNKVKLNDKIYEKQVLAHQVAIFEEEAPSLSYENGQVLNQKLKEAMQLWEGDLSCAEKNVASLCWENLYAYCQRQKNMSIEKLCVSPQHLDIRLRTFTHHFRDLCMYLQSAAIPCSIERLQISPVGAVQDLSVLYYSEFLITFSFPVAYE